MGVYPNSFLGPIRASVDNIVQRAAAAQKAAQADDTTKTAIPAKAGTHGSADRASDKWVPAFAGMTTGEAQRSAVFWTGAGMKRWGLR